jgi:hypothetical protein
MPLINVLNYSESCHTFHPPKHLSAKNKPTAKYTVMKTNYSVPTETGSDFWIELAPMICPQGIVEKQNDSGITHKVNCKFQGTVDEVNAQKSVLDRIFNQSLRYVIEKSMIPGLTMENPSDMEIRGFYFYPSEDDKSNPGKRLTIQGKEAMMSMGLDEFDGKIKTNFVVKTATGFSAIPWQALINKRFTFLPQIYFSDFRKTAGSTGVKYMLKGAVITKIEDADSTFQPSDTANMLPVDESLAAYIDSSANYVSSAPANPIQSHSSFSLPSSAPVSHSLPPSAPVSHAPPQTYQPAPQTYQPIPTPVFDVGAMTSQAPQRVDQGQIFTLPQTLPQSQYTTQ